jgi:uncharacterized membrane protein YbaN (DUF454 family)
MIGQVRTAAGFVLLGAGVIGTLLPVIPGVPLVVAGLALLGREHRVTRAITDRVRAWRRRPDDSRQA